MSQEGLIFKLFVTGHTEQASFSRMFQSLYNVGPFRFKVEQRIGQLSPRKDGIEQLKIVKTNGSRPSMHQTDQFLGLKVRGELMAGPNTLVIIVDDLEYDRKEQATEIFNRYRNAIDTIITNAQMRRRASIHFLVMMLEAYYFAHSQAVNQALGADVFTNDFAGDVETIRNPYGELKQLFGDFDKRKHGDEIIGRLNVEQILSNPQTCASLRTMFAWCVEAILEFYPKLENPFPNYHLDDGIQYAVTNGQLNILKRDSHQ